RSAGSDQPRVVRLAILLASASAASSCRYTAAHPAPKIQLVAKIEGQREISSAASRGARRKVRPVGRIAQGTDGWSGRDCREFRGAIEANQSARLTKARFSGLQILV